MTDAEHRDVPDPVRDALASSERPRKLTIDERRRIESAVNAHGDRVSRRHMSRPALWVAVAASIAIVLGVGLGNGEPGVDVITDAIANPAADRCDEIGPELVEGLEAWQTIEDWSLASNPSPDLARLALAVIETLPDSPPAETLRSELSDVVDQSPSVTPAESVERARVVEDAIVFLVEYTDSESNLCRSPTLERFADSSVGS